MARWIIVLSGRIRSGKTTLAEMLSNRLGMRLIKTHDLIKKASSKLSLSGRIPLQKYGERLDKETQGKWVATELAQVVFEEGNDGAYIVDSARIPEQISAIRLAFPSVAHIHLTASEEELRRRYEKQAAIDHDSVPYEVAKRNKTERGVERLAEIADIVIDTGRCTDEDVFVRATSRMSIYKHSSGYVDVVIGGEYGSEGKGQIVNYLAHEYDVIVRVGGPNAGHTVFDTHGLKHIYHHLPSGAMTHSAHFVLAPGMVVNAAELLEEINECKLESNQVSIDPKVMTISKTDIESEKQLYRRIGSTARGVGAATARRINDRGLKSVKMAGKVRDLAPFIRPTYQVLFEALAMNKRILIEGTQGTGLSLYHGPYPYVTSRDTAVAGCLSEAGISPNHVRRIIMVCRTYPIRVGNPKGDGNSGPLSKEIDWGIVSKRSGIPRSELEATEIGSTTGRRRRVGEFEWDLLRKAAFLNGPTDIALTFADYVSKRNRTAVRFEQLTDETIEIIEEVERVAGAPASLISNDKGKVIDRRSW